MATMVITINSARSQVDLARFIGDPSSPRGQCRALKNFFQRVEAGVEHASVDIQTSASSPVRATNTLTLTYGSISNNDTVVIGGTTLTAVTGTPSGNAQFKKASNGTVTASNLASCINTNPTLNTLMSASANGSTVVLSLDAAGAVGNQVPVVGSTGIVPSSSTFASGAGGEETAPVHISRGKT